jgi:hypothetical protein
LHVATVTIAERFRGPPDSGNGGYVAGLLAGYAPQPMVVRLAAPAPLGIPLELIAPDGASLELRAGRTLIAAATAATLELAVPAPPSYAAAQDAAGRYAGSRGHASPGCFVCGPGRAPGDGLRLFAGPLAGSGAALYAAPWEPDPSLAGTRHAVRPEFLAAALDCPGYFAVAPDARLLLLGSLTLRIKGAVQVGEPCVIVAWSLGGEGRKWRAASAVYGADGDCVARGVAVWIEPRRDLAAAANPT